MSETVLVTSCKGGIGKSTVAANLSMALAMSGYTVLTVDCDFTMRCLDLIMGLEDRVMFSLLDIIKDRCKPERAILHDMRAEGLYFLSAPSKNREDISAEEFCELFRQLKDYKVNGKKFDYIIIDSPAADSESVRLAASVSNEAIIVCSHMPTAIRAAEQTSEILSSYGIEKQKLLINSFDVYSALKAYRAGIAEMIDSAKLMLIGVVPFDRTLLIHQENGGLIDGFPKKNNARRAFINMAGRLDGRQIPLFEGFIGSEYKKILKTGK